ncbi:MAG: DUF5330 domain-containing protein [Rhizobiales bacterium]|nr:DUF5330 domain-containing protein [Hyphomicrobiales bacterium]
MFFLMRVAFWLSVVVWMIPADPQSGADAPRVTMVQAFMAARATIADLSGFCGRNPDVCVTGHAAAQIFSNKAETGVRMLYQYLNEPGTAAEESPAAAPADSALQGTLTPADMVPAWRGKGGAA